MGANDLEIRSFMSKKKYRFFIRNYSSIGISLQSPATAMPLPLAGDASNILTKAEGNTLRVSVTWTIHDEDTVVVQTNQYDTDGSNDDEGIRGTVIKGLGGSSGNEVKTADDQIKFLLNNQRKDNPTFSGFQSTFIEDKYQMIIGDIGFSRIGLIESVDVQKQGNAPITWQATLNFVAGAVVASGDD